MLSSVPNICSPPAPQATQYPSSQKDSRSPSTPQPPLPCNHPSGESGTPAHRGTLCTLKSEHDFRVVGVKLTISFFTFFSLSIISDFFCFSTLFFLSFFSHKKDLIRGKLIKAYSRGLLHAHSECDSVLSLRQGLRKWLTPPLTSVAHSFTQEWGLWYALHCGSSATFPSPQSCPNPQKPLYVLESNYEPVP